MNFQYKLSYAGKPDFSLNNEIPASKDFYLHDIPFENLNDAPVFEFDFSLLQPEKSKAPHFETSLKLKAKQVFHELKRSGKKEKRVLHINYLNDIRINSWKKKNRNIMRPAKKKINYTMQNKAGSIWNRQNMKWICILKN